MNRHFTAWGRRIDLMDVAALFTWAVVTLAVTPWDARGPGKIAIAVLLGAFLCGFLALPRRSGIHDASRVFAALAVMICSVFGLLLVGPRHSTPILFIIAAGSVAYHLPVRTTLSILVAMIIGQLLVLQLHWKVPNALLALGGYAGFQAFAALASYAMRQSEQRAEELERLNAHLLATRYLLEESARDGERLRMSRELHDLSGHKLTALKLNLTLLQRDPEFGHRKELTQCATLAQELLQDIRQVVSQIRQHDGINVGEALRRLGERIPSPRIHVDVATDARVDDAARAETLLRLAQEGITNAVRHAAARNVWLKVAINAQHLELSIEDDGKANLPLKHGNGLRGMRERVATLDGEIAFTTNVKGGLVVRAKLPRELPT